VPKVLGNPPIVLGDGRWLLPFWREAPRGQTLCRANPEAADGAGALLSPDGGRTWAPRGHIRFEKRLRDSPRPDWLIEGAAVALRNGSALMLFRTDRGVAYKARSDDGGESWTSPSPSQLLNPNAKMTVLRLKGRHKAELVAAHNNHTYLKVDGSGVGRGNLILSTSADEGETWQPRATLEARLAAGELHHYPAMVQLGCRLLVAYSSGGLGIRLATIAL